MERPSDLREVLLRVSNESLSRRSLLRRVGALSLTVAGVSSLLAACGGDDDDDDDQDADSTEVAEPTADAGDADPTATTAGDATSEPEPTSDDDEGSDDEGAEGGEVRFHYGSAPRTLNSLFSTSNREHAFEAMMYGALAKIDDGFEAQLDLASNLEVSDDATVYTFTLHDGITFTDGEQLTSDDVRFTFERALNPATGSVWRGRFLGIAGAEAYSGDDAEGVEGINAPDDLTIEFTLAEPNAVFLLTICGTAGFGILPEHVLAEVAPDELADHEFSRAPTVTAGPYKFARYETDQFLEWERNDDYFGPRPAVDRIFGLILEPSIAVAQIETGELDIMPELEHEAIERIEALDHVTVHSVPSAIMSNLTINVTRPYLQDKRVRQAMMYAIDHEGIMNAAIQGQGRVQYHPFIAPESMQEVDGLTEYTYDPDRARELLEEAGWDNSQTVEILHGSNINVWWITTMTIIQQQFADVGIQAELVPVDSAEYNVRTIDSDDFDLTPLGGATGDPDAFSAQLATGSIPPSGVNRGRYSNEQVDELFAQGRATNDIEERQEIYSEMARILNDEVPQIFLFSPNNLSAYSNRLSGYSAPAFRDNTLWDAPQWSIEE